MLDQLLQLDRQLFMFLNGMGSESWDLFWEFITRQINWIPVFAIFAYLVFKNLGWRHALLVLAMLALLIALTDQTTNLVKAHFHRLRPGSDPEVSHFIRAVIVRNSFSFFSGHASNSMAAAMFLFLLLRNHVKFMGFIFLWPLIFAYSRIYLGLHYPLDIFCGYIWGILMALIVWQIYLLSHRKLFPNEQEHLHDPTDGESVPNR